MPFRIIWEKEGIPKAFLTDAAEDAVLMRKNTLVIGKTGIAQQFENEDTSGHKVSLSRKPDFVDASNSGDLGYTYDTFTYPSQDSLGQINELNGVFHTVWKRQADGNWCFVWD